MRVISNAANETILQSLTIWKRHCSTNCTHVDPSLILGQTQDVYEWFFFCGYILPFFAPSPHDVSYEFDSLVKIVPSASEWSMQSPVHYEGLFWPFQRWIRDVIFVRSSVHAPLYEGFNILRTKSQTKTTSQIHRLKSQIKPLQYHFREPQFIATLLVTHFPGYLAHRWPESDRLQLRVLLVLRSN